jgi:hypothetical protein
MPTRTASFSSGQLTATVEGDPVRVSVCHCLACQRRKTHTINQAGRALYDKLARHHGFIVYSHEL